MREPTAPERSVTIVCGAITLAIIVICARLLVMP